MLIALWLPLQGYAAVAMPFCSSNARAHAGKAVASAHQQDGHSGHMNHDKVDHDAATGPDSGHGDADKLACNNCGPCHLACSPLIFAVTPSLGAPGNPVFQPVSAESLYFFFPEQPQRPPLSALL